MARWTAALLLVFACGSEPRKIATPQTPPALDAGTTDGTPIEPTRPEVTARPPRGAPHAGQVTMTAVSNAGTVALSLDALGEVRLWPALDGTRAPRAVPVRIAHTMRVQEAAGGILAGFTYTHGGGHLVRFDRAGERLGVAEVTGPGAVLQVMPLGDASGAIALYADHSLALLAPDGTTLSTLARRATRIRAIEAVGPTSAIALLRIATGDGGSDHAVARIETAGGTLAWGREVELPLTPLEPTRFAVAPDGKRVAFTRSPDDTAAKEEAERRAARRRPGPPKPDAPRLPPPPTPPQVPSKIAVVDLTTGADITPAEVAQQPLTDVVSLGFSSPTRLHVFDARTQSDIDLTSGVMIAGSLVRTGAPSIARDLLLAGFDVSLVLQVPGGATRYLGWAASMPQRAALAPDGTQAAWATARGELMIEALDGSREVYGGLYDAPITALSFIGNTHVLVGSARGSVHLVDAGTGRELAAMMPPGPLQAADVDPTTGWLAGLRPGGGVWLVRVTPGGDTPMTPLAVADGATAFTLLAPGAPDGALLQTTDGKHALRRYTEAELIAGVSSQMVRDRAKETLPRPMYRYDRTGRGFALDGRRILVFEGAVQDPQRTVSIGFDPIDLAVSPDGEVMVLLDRQHAVIRIARDGKPMWTVALGPGGRWAWAFSEAGDRLAVVGGGGGQILDAATGERVHASCAWRFGVSAAPPLSRAAGMAPVCQ